MSVTIEREPADTPAVSLLRARDAESNALYPPHSQFYIPIGSHADGRIIFIVAREDAAAIGCGALQLHDFYAELESIYLVPAARGRRLGERIVETLEEISRHLGLLDLKLETGVRSPTAIRTYERLGHRRCDRFGDYPYEPAQRVHGEAPATGVRQNDSCYGPHERAGNRPVSGDKAKENGHE